MSAIYISKLNNEVEKNIRHSKYSLEEIEHIKANISEIINMGKKRFALVLTILGVCAFTVSILGISKGGINEAWIVSTLGIIPIMAIIVGFIWFIGIGNLKNNYNRAVRKGYPEYVDRLRL